MSITDLYSNIMSLLSPILILSGFLALTFSLISMLVNMIIGAASGKGFSIGLK